ncbi:MAG TPA: aquaporin [Candidatus Dormibacteraeota bacterium]|nr:aquaporin [Candidatus Dormibacteraeota bacterium]
MPSAAKLVTELVGTFLFVSVIALSGPAGSFAPLAIGSALMAMVYMGGHVSGAHYNPAVSFGIFLRRKIGGVEMLAYWAAQMTGAVLAFVVGYLVSGHSPGIHPGAKVDVFQALAVEILFTAGLVLVVLNVALTKALQGNSFYGLAIGFTIAAAIFVGGPISGGAYNPAVGFGATVGAALFAGGGWSDFWLYVAGPLVGAAIGAAIHAVQTESKQASGD